MGDFLGQIYDPEAVADAVDDIEVRVDIETYVRNLAREEIILGGGTGGGGVAVPVQTLNIAQYPNFTLQYPIVAASSSKLFLNGIKQRFGIDYNLQSSTVLQWIGFDIPGTVPNPVLELFS